MVTTASNNFEGGTDGVAVSTGNSGGSSGTAFDAIWGTGLTFSATDSTQGTMGAAVAGSAFGAAIWNVSSTKVSAHMKFKPKAIPTTGDCYLMRFHNGSGTRLFDVHMQGTGHLRIFDATGANVWTSAAALSASTKYRLEAYVVAGTTTSNGTIKVAYYLDNSTTPIEMTTTAATPIALGTSNVGAGQTFATVYLGKYNNAPEAYGFDEFAVDTTLSDFIGVGTSSPPTVSTPPIQNPPTNTAVNVSVTASSSSGTIQSYAWSYTYPAGGTGAPTLSGASTNTVSFTTPSTAGKLYQLQCIVTDSNGLTTTVQTEVRVPTAADTTVLPGSPTNVVGTWANVGGAATPGDALADLLPATYIESAALSATGQSERFRVTPMQGRSSLDIPVKFSLGSAGTVTAKARLYQGTTLLQEWSHTPTSTNPATPDSFTDSASGATIAAITDWGNLWYEPYGTSP